MEELALENLEELAMENLKELAMHRQAMEELALHRQAMEELALHRQAMEELAMPNLTMEELAMEEAMADLARGHQCFIEQDLIFQPPVKLAFTCAYVLVAGQSSLDSKTLSCLN